MHVDGERGRGRAIGEPALLAAHLGERQAVAAQFLRHGDLQISRRAQRLEVLGEEAVFAIVSGRALAAVLDQCFR